MTVILSALSFLTAFYTIRIALFVANKNGLEKKNENILELIALSCLFILNILFYIYLRGKIQYQIAEPFWSALTAWVCVYVLYRKKAFWKVPILYPLTFNGFYLDKFYTTICVKLYEIFSKLCDFIDTKIFGNYFLITTGAKFSVNIFNFIEAKIMNGTVKSVTELCKSISTFDLKAQNGNIQKYNAYAFVKITIIITCLVLGYTATAIFIRGLNG